MTLETLESKTISFLQKLRYGISKKASLLFMLGAFACSSPNVSVKNVAGITIKTAYTDQNGEARFTDEETGKQFKVFSRDKVTGRQIGDTKVTFGDANRFNSFYLERKDYHVVFQTLPTLTEINKGDYAKADSPAQKGDFAGMLEFMFELNPSDYTSFTAWDAYHEENQDKINAMEEYMQWAENEGYKYVRCMTKEEMAKARDYTAEIISSASGWKVVSTAYNRLVQLDDWGLIDSLPEEVYHIYEPLNFTAPPYIEGSSYNSEVCDSVDNNCDGRVDEGCAERTPTKGCKDGEKWVDLGNGVIKDCDSQKYVSRVGDAPKLFWEKERYHSTGWSDAEEYCETLSLGGFADWRLPTENELKRLMKQFKDVRADDSGCCTVAPFTEGQCGSYWSSESSSERAGEKIFAKFAFCSTDRDVPSMDYDAKCVRKE